MKRLQGFGLHPTHRWDDNESYVWCKNCGTRPFTRPEICVHEVYPDAGLKPSLFAADECRNMEEE